MILLRRAIALALTAALGGCVLLVDSFETSDHCGIQGAGACAKCMRSSCQPAIDRCCNDNECLGGRMLGAIDACGRGETGSCADILASARGVASEEDIRSCVAASCRQVCTSSATSGDSGSGWACTTYSGGEYCQCSTATSANDKTCRPETVGVDADCVSGTDGCTCGQYACTDTSLGCTCAFRGGVFGTTCSRPVGGSCCAKQGPTGITCYCEDYSACRISDGEVELDSCGREDVIAWAGSTGAVVSSCSR